VEGLEKLPPLHNISYYMGIPTGFGAFSLPEVIEALRAEESGRSLCALGLCTEICRKGTRRAFAGRAFTGTVRYAMTFRGTMASLDMYRRPDKVIKVCEHILPFMIEMAVNAKVSGNPRYSYPSTRAWMIHALSSLRSFSTLGPRAYGRLSRKR
jgi:hypothetical protein